MNHMRRGEEGNGIGFSLSKRPLSNISIIIEPPSRQTCFDSPPVCVYWCLHILDGFYFLNTMPLGKPTFGHLPTKLEKT